MPSPLLVFRIGYMTSYDGIGKITGGGSYVEDKGEGGEMWNFRPEAGRCYAYVMTKSFAGVDTNQAVPGSATVPGDELPGVDIVFIAKRPGFGQVVVGWYRGATVFHKKYLKRRGKKEFGDWTSIEYLAEVDADRAHLLPEAQRTFPIPRGKSLPGTSNVWYPNATTPASAKLTNDLRKLMAATGKAPIVLKPGKKGGRTSAPNKDHMLKVEKASVDLVWKHYEGKQYVVRSVEMDYCGWDLEATKSGKTLRLEVKGHAGQTIQFELTPNEYSMMQRHSDDYRLCVVRDALGTPDLVVFRPEEVDAQWYLASKTTGERIALLERTGARATRID